MKIRSRKELAISLNSGSVDINNISKCLNFAVNLWLKRKEIVLIDGKLSLTNK
jgi:hypothetical protein